MIREPANPLAKDIARAMHYIFADCHLDTENFRFFRSGAPTPIEPQVFDLLRLLAQNAGRLVTRDELIAGVWGGRIVSEATISARINAARTAVGDTGKVQAVIRTVPRRGIELVVPVETRGAGPVAEPASPPHGPVIQQDQTIRYTTSADGTPIAYAISGNPEGPPLLRASHHLTHLEMEWHSPLCRPLFDALGEDRRLIRYDIRGTGLSGPHGGSSDLKSFVDDLAAVADANGLDRFPILATLNSAASAIRFAAENPDRVSHLVIQEGYARGRALRAPEGAPKRDDPFVSLLHSGGWGNPQNGYMRAFISIAAPALTYDDATALIELFATASSIEGAIANRKIIDHFDARPYLPRVQVPTLIIHARNDSLHPLAEGQALAAGIPGAEFLVVESANTVCLSPDPTWNEQTRAVLAFLSRG